MNTNNDRSVGTRLLNSLFAIALVAAVVYILVSGFELLALGAIAVALVGAATPVVIAGEGFLEVVIGILQAFVEGVVGNFEAIASALSSLFS